MRFKVKNKSLTHGDTRSHCHFLWIPKVINGEIRWLEKACYMQKVVQIDVGGSNEWGKFKNVWKNKKWID